MPTREEIISQWNPINLDKSEGITFDAPKKPSASLDDLYGTNKSFDIIDKSQNPDDDLYANMPKFTSAEIPPEIPDDLFEERGFWGNTNEEFLRGLAEFDLNLKRAARDQRLISDDEVKAQEKVLMQFETLDPVIRDNMISRLFGSIARMGGMIGRDLQARMIGGTIAAIPTVITGGVAAPGAVARGQQAGSYTLWYTATSGEISDALQKEGIDRTSAIMYGNTAAVIPAALYSIPLGGAFKKKINDVLIKEIKNRAIVFGKETLKGGVTGTATMTAATILKESEILAAKVIEDKIIEEEIIPELGEIGKRAVHEAIDLFPVMFATHGITGASKLIQPHPGPMGMSLRAYEKLERQANDAINVMNISAREKMERLDELAKINPLTPEQKIEYANLAEGTPAEKIGPATIFLSKIKKLWRQQGGELEANDIYAAEKLFEQLARRKGMTTDEYVEKYYGPVYFAPDEATPNLGALVKMIKGLTKNEAETLYNELQRKYNYAKDGTEEKLKAEKELDVIGDIIDSRGDIDRKGILNQIVGQSANELFVSNQKIQFAEQLESEGVSPLEIREKTGWERGLSNQWVLYLDPKKIKINSKTFTSREGNYRLEDFLVAPELFAAYPALRDIAIAFNSLWGSKSRGVFISNKLTENIKFLREANLPLSLLGKSIIAIKDTLPTEKILETIQHELSHTISIYEKNWEKGVGKDMIVGKDVKEGKIEALEKLYSEYSNRLDDAQAKTKLEIYRYETTEPTTAQKTRVEDATRAEKAIFRERMQVSADLESAKNPTVHARYLKGIAETEARLNVYLSQRTPEELKAKTIREHTKDMLVKEGLLKENQSVDEILLTDSQLTDDRVSSNIAGYKGPPDQIVGESASGILVPNDKLKLAKSMEKEGKSPIEIRDATGWERGLSNQWVIYLDPKEIKLNPNLIMDLNNPDHPYPLKDVISAPKLFAAYPMLSNTFVLFRKVIKNYLGTFAFLKDSATAVLFGFPKELGGKTVIEVNIEKVPKQGVISTIRHELAHNISLMELNWEKGVSPGVVIGKDIKGGKVEALEKLYSENTKKLEDAQAKARLEIYRYETADEPTLNKKTRMEEAIQAENDILRERVIISADLEREKTPNRLNRYIKGAAEVEARLNEYLVQRTPEELKSKTIREHAKDMLTAEGLLKENQSINDVLLTDRQLTDDKVFGAIAAMEVLNNPHPERKVFAVNIIDPKDPSKMLTVGYITAKNRLDAKITLEKGTYPARYGLEKITLQEVEPYKGKPKDVKPGELKQGELFQHGQSSDRVVRGAVEFTKEAKAIITAFKAPNFSTFIHEVFGHPLFFQLGNKHLDALSNAYKIKKILLEKYMADPTAKSFTIAEWREVKVAMENFAQHFERYIWEGKAPLSTLRPVFEHMKEAMRRIYVSIKGELPTLPLSMRKVFDDLLVTESERFGGKIMTTGKDKNGRPISYPVERFGNNAVIYIDADSVRSDAVGVEFVQNSDGTFPKDKRIRMYVDNMIRGERVYSKTTDMVEEEFTGTLNQTQKDFLGTDAIWRSPFELVEKPIYRQPKLPLDIEVQIRDLHNLSDKELAKLAKRLGVSARVIGGSKEESHKLLIATLESRLTSERQNLNDRTSPDRREESYLIPSVSKQPTDIPLSRRIVDKIGDILSPWMTDLVTRVQFSGGGGDVQTLQAIRGQRTITASRLLRETLEPIRSNISRLVHKDKEGKKAFHSLMELIRIEEAEVDGVKGWLATDRLSLAIDEATNGKYARNLRLSPREQEIVNAIKDLNAETGRLAKELKDDDGVPIQVQIFFRDKDADGKWTTSSLPFEPQIDRLNRHQTAEGYWLFNSSHPAASMGRKLMASLWAKANPELDAKHTFDLINQYKERRISSTIGLEHERKIRVYGTHFIDKNGKAVRLIESDSLRYTAKEIVATTSRLGFIKHFGQDPKVYKANIDNFGLPGVGGNSKDLERMYQSFQGIPIDSPPIKLEPNTMAWAMMNHARNVFALAKAGFLGIPTTLLNIPQPLTVLPAQVGWKRFGEAMVKAGMHVPEYFFDKVMDALNKERIRNPNYIESMLKIHRTISGYAEHTPDFMIRPESKYSDITRRISDTMMWYQGVTPINKWNDFLSTIAADLFIKDLRDGNGGVMDRSKLQALKFTDAEIAVMMTGGKGAENLYNAIYSRIPQQGQGSDLSAAQKSRWANYPGYSNTLIFDTYARTITAYNWWLFHQATEKGLPPKERFARWAQIGSFIGGSTAAGFMGLLIRNLYNTGVTNTNKLMTDWDDDDDGAVDMVEGTKHATTLIGDSLLTSLLSGYGVNFYYKLQQKNYDVMPALFQTTLPGSLLDTLQLVLNPITGIGPYSSMTELEGIETAMSRLSSSARFAKTILGVWGIGKYNPDMVVAERKYYAFVKSHIGSSTKGAKSGPLIFAEPNAWLDYRKEKYFTYHMKKAYELMKTPEGNWLPGGSRSDKIVSEIEKALAVQGASDNSWTGVASSIRSHKKITKEIVELYQDEFIKEVGYDNAMLLMKHDQILESWASGFDPNIDMTNETKQELE